MPKIAPMLLIVLIIAAIAPFALPLKNGEPLLKWSDISMPKLPSIPKLPTLPNLNSDEKEKSAPITTYKWKDANGNWHLGDTPPVDFEYETVITDPNTNLIQGSTATFSETPSAPVKERPMPSTYSPTMAYDSEKVGKIIDSARNIDKLLQQRKEQQDQLLQEMQ